MEEMTYLGAQWGVFKNKDGDKINYCHLFAIQEFTGSENSEYHTTGMKAVKHKLANPSLVEGLEPFDVVEVYFNSKSLVTKLVKKGSGGTADMDGQKKAS